MKFRCLVGRLYKLIREGVCPCITLKKFRIYIVGQNPKKYYRKTKKRKSFKLGKYFNIKRDKKMFNQTIFSSNILKGHSPIADLRYGVVESISFCTQIFVAIKG